MKVYKFLMIVIILIPLETIGQTSQPKVDIYELPIPRNIDECFTILEIAMPEDEIKLIKELPEERIPDHPEVSIGTDFFHAWKLNSGSGSRLVKYFNKMGLVGPNPIYQTILISYHRQLNGQFIELQAQIKKWRASQNAETEAYRERTQKDSLNGVYIPKNINECVFELEKVYGEKSKSEFYAQEKNKVLASAYKQGMGLWVRNNWGLSNGSRLQKYFYENGVREPEDMTLVILTCYYNYANKKPLGFRPRK
jgi:hypothetical protein